MPISKFLPWLLGRGILELHPVHNSQEIIHNQLCDVFAHKSTRLHRADEALYAGRIVEAFAKLQIFECYTRQLVGV